MTTIATDGRSMAGDGRAIDQRDTIVSDARTKVRRLSDGRIVGTAGNSFDAAAYVDWIEQGKPGGCPIEDDRFGALILNLDGTVTWVDGKGREMVTPTPCAIGSGQDLAIGAMEAGADPFAAVMIAARRDPWTGGRVSTLFLTEPLEQAA